jgi:hypothetical protein
MYRWPFSLTVDSNITKSARSLLWAVWEKSTKVAISKWVATWRVKQ